MLAVGDSKPLIEEVEHTPPLMRTLAASVTNAAVEDVFSAVEYEDDAAAAAAVAAEEEANAKAEEAALLLARQQRQQQREDTWRAVERRKPPTAIRETPPEGQQHAQDGAHEHGGACSGEVQAMQQQEAEEAEAAKAAVLAAKAAEAAEEREKAAKAKAAAEAAEAAAKAVEVVSTITPSSPSPQPQPKDATADFVFCGRGEDRRVARLRTLRKKLKQVGELVRRRDEGNEILSEEEENKVSTRAGHWSSSSSIY